MFEQSIDIAPVRWTEDQAYPYNNFIYKVILSSPASADNFRRTAHGQQQQQPCTDVPPTEGVSTFIVRLSNPRAIGLNNTNRVENEVAAIHIARGAVVQAGSGYAGVVPAVYAWKAAAGPDPVDETGFGWIVMEYLKGSSLNAQFESFEMIEKKRVIHEIAAIFSAMQAAKLPPGVDRFGGLTIDDMGNIVSGQETLQGVPGGPWYEYEEVWRHQLLCQLKEADKSPVIEGWRMNGIRDRIEQFSCVALRPVIQNTGIDMSKLAFVHLDFSKYWLEKVSIFHNLLTSLPQL